MDKRRNHGRPQLTFKRLSWAQGPLVGKHSGVINTKRSIFKSRKIFDPYYKRRYVVGILLEAWCYFQIPIWNRLAKIICFWSEGLFSVMIRWWADQKDSSDQFWRWFWSEGWFFAPPRGGSFPPETSGSKTGNSRQIRGGVNCTFHCTAPVNSVFHRTEQNWIRGWILLQCISMNWSVLLQSPTILSVHCNKHCFCWDTATFQYFSV